MRGGTGHGHRESRFYWKSIGFHCKSRHQGSWRPVGPSHRRSRLPGRTLEEEEEEERAEEGGGGKEGRGRRRPSDVHTERECEYR